VSGFMRLTVNEGDKNMPIIQMEQILEQLPKNTQIIRVYTAFEGDLRVIVRLPGETFERRYTLELEEGRPRIKEMS
jgi:hypothetical protein